MTKNRSFWIWAVIGLATIVVGASLPLMLSAQPEHDMSKMSGQAGAKKPQPSTPPAHGAAPTSKKEAQGKTVYYCAMHPEIVQDHPGTCPICGMDLTPKPAAAPAAAGGKQRKIKYWVAPMDPTYISDKPGKSPMGMDLVPVYEEPQRGSPSEVTIDPVVVQNMGVRIAKVERGPIFRHVRTIGSVDVAENELSVVNLRYSGWIEHIHVDETGERVKRGQRLFDIYSPELVSAENEYLLSLRSAGPGSPMANSARAKLQFWDLSDAQIAQIEKAGSVSRTLTVTAPRTGYVLQKNVVEGARVQAGVDLYRIGNLSKIWVNADVYEFDAPWVELGERATMELSFQAGKRYEGRVSYIYPTLNPKTRTLTVRLEFENPGLALKPGMFATVQIEVQRKEDVLKVPTEAIIHSGTRQIVFVALDMGKYAMREITTGLTGDRYVSEVLDGLREGERVVTSGQFLLDSESQLQEAVEKLMDARLQAKEPAPQSSAASAPEGDAATAAADEGGGANGDAAKATATPAHADQKPHQAGKTTPTSQSTYWTCSMHPQVVQDHPGTCPICGMTLVQKKR